MQCVFESFGVFVVPKNSLAVLRSLTEHGNVLVRSSEQDRATRGDSHAVLFFGVCVLKFTQ